MQLNALVFRQQSNLSWQQAKRIKQTLKNAVVKAHAWMSVSVSNTNLYSEFS